MVGGTALYVSIVILTLFENSFPCSKVILKAAVRSMNHITGKAAGMSLTLGTVIDKSCIRDSRTVKRIYWSRNNAKRGHEKVSISSENRNLTTTLL
jgi:hypothetical protein